MQLKFKSPMYKVQPKDIREFSGTLHKQAEGVIGFFVTNVQYTKNAENEVTNLKKRKIILCNENNIIESIKLALKEHEKQSEETSVIEEIVFENIELNEYDKADIFGIKIEGKCKIGTLKVKRIANRFKPY